MYKSVFRKLIRHVNSCIPSLKYILINTFGRIKHSFWPQTLSSYHLSSSENWERMVLQILICNESKVWHFIHMHLCLHTLFLFPFTNKWVFIRCDCFHMWLFLLLQTLHKICPYSHTLHGGQISTILLHIIPCRDVN